MNLLELCKRADAERSKSTCEAILLLRSILAWFQSLPNHFDEEEIREMLPQVVADEDDIFDCNLTKQGHATISIYNMQVNKEIKLSRDEISLFKNFKKLFSTKIYSISQVLSENAPTEIFFYFKKENEFWRFYNLAPKILPSIEIDFEYDKDISEDNDRLVCMYIYHKDLVAN